MTLYNVFVNKNGETYRAQRKFFLTESAAKLWCIQHNRSTSAVAACYIPNMETVMLCLDVPMIKIQE